MGQYTHSMKRNSENIMINNTIVNTGFILIGDYIKEHIIAVAGV